MLNKIRSKYILKNITSYLNPRIYLLLYKYNKNLQKKFELTKKDYKEYNQIEIEIIPTESIKEGKNTIIHYFNDEKQYYHIFIDDKELNKRNYFRKKENVKKIKVLIDFEINSLKRLFHGCEYIKEINFVKFNRNNIIDMNFLFCDCFNLININLSKKQRMDEMFEGCVLFDLDLSNFNTSNVTNMNKMFFGCYNLKNLNISNFNTSKVNEMSHMFFYCSHLISLDVSSFNTSHVFTMEYMFGLCMSLIDLNIANFY